MGFTYTTGQTLKIKAVCLVLLLLFKFNGGLPVLAQTMPKSLTKEAQVTISGSLGEPILKLWGYGAPNCRVEMNGVGVGDFTYSKPDGYFEFPKAYLPQPAELLYPELCLTEIDSAGRATPPTCIPPLPANEFNYDIGPVILPPTLSLEEGSVTPSSQAGASGVTIPNSDIRIVLAENKGRSNLAGFTIIKEAEAYYIPDYTIKSDSRGNFSFNMPTGKPDTWRVFAVTNYSPGGTSPKSNTLKFEVLSPTLAGIAKFWAFILSLLTLPTLIVSEIVVILLIVAAIVFGKKGKKKLSSNTINTVKEYQNYLKSRQPF